MRIRKGEKTMGTRNARFVRALIAVAVALLATGTMLVWTGQTPVSAQETTPVTISAPVTAAVTHTVVAGETLTRIANRYGVTVDELVAWNGIENRDLIYVDQVLVVSSPQAAGAAPVAASAGGPLAMSWSVIDWRPADPDYVATIEVRAWGGTPPYVAYHDGLVQESDTFEIAWARCQPKPGSIWVADATGAMVKQDYWLLAPYCPVGVEIVEPEEGAHLEHYPRNFNVTWVNTVSPPPSAYGIEIEVWEDGDWHPWKTYIHRKSGGTLFFVPDEFPGDLGGRVRMWGIYGSHDAATKTPWRYFEFRVTY
jgi:LysM repeat protein